MNEIEQGANKRYNYYFASRWEKLLLDSKLIDGAVLNDFGHVSISTISAQFLPACVEMPRPVVGLNPPVYD